jgi:hypothetical protein
MNNDEQQKWDKITAWTLRIMIVAGAVLAWLVASGRVDSIILG